LRKALYFISKPFYLSWQFQGRRKVNTSLIFTSTPRFYSSIGVFLSMSQSSLLAGRNKQHSFFTRIALRFSFISQDFNTLFCLILMNWTKLNRCSLSGITKKKIYEELRRYRGFLFSHKLGLQRLVRDFLTDILIN